MSNFEPVVAFRAADGVGAQIRQRIESGELRPGDRLPSERELAAQFNVSRNTVREAIRSLEAAGVVQLKKGATGGAFIREGSSMGVVSSFNDLLAVGTILPEHLGEARTIVGSATARLACERADKQDLAALEVCVNEAVAAAKAGDLPRRARANFQFHRELARASKNPILEVLTDAVISINQKLANQIGSPPNELIIPSRKRLMRHLLERNAQAASEEMEAHLKRLEIYYRRAAAAKSKA
jgi:DNA-binding FadR family transcriptional regulator